MLTIPIEMDFSVLSRTQVSVHSGLTYDQSIALLRKTEDYVKNIMSQPSFDASHDSDHVSRVAVLTTKILGIENRDNPNIEYNPMKVLLAALLHDVEDRKYCSQVVEGKTPEGPKKYLLTQGCPPPLAGAVQEVINAVSYSTEIGSPELVQRMLTVHPELAIVQDADRLDALGAVGIGRAFTYGAVKGCGRGLEGTLKHFDEKLLKLQGMMKTEEGRRLAKIRTHRLIMFKEWWEEEVRNPMSATSDHPGLIP